MCDGGNKDGNESKSSKRTPIPTGFCNIKHIDIIISLLKAAPRLNLPISLQLEPFQREEASLSGGIDAHTLVIGLISEKCIRNVQDIAMKRKEVLGV